MEKSSVLVRVTGPDPRGTKTEGASFFYSNCGLTTFSCSGFASQSHLSSPFIVLSSASMISPFLDEDGTLKPIPGVDIEIFFESGDSIPCNLYGIYACDETVDAARRLVRTSLPSNRGVHHGSLMVLVPIDCSIDSVPCLKVTHERPKRGSSLTVMSSPFGLVSPVVFQNSVTTGVLSNSMQSFNNTDTLYLTDARCLPGSEGGMVVDSFGNTMGMLMPTLNRSDKSALELTGIIPIECFQKELQLICSETASVSEDDSYSRAAQSVVLISIHSSWGSGIAISHDGYIITCAHLFRSFTKKDENTGRLVMKNNRSKIRIVFRDTDDISEIDADLVFCSSSSVDIALLKIDRYIESIAVCSIRQPLAGDPCAAIGHAIFDPSINLQSTISTGVVSKVVTNEGSSAMYQTCTNVFRGHSGGLLADRHGALLGLLTSNARHSNGKIIPTINFTLPFNVFAPLIDSITFPALERETIYDMYDEENPALLSLWRLETGSMHNEPELPTDSNFADFLSKL